MTALALPPQGKLHVTALALPQQGKLHVTALALAQRQNEFLTGDLQSMKNVRKKCDQLLKLAIASVLTTLFLKSSSVHFLLCFVVLLLLSYKKRVLCVSFFPFVWLFVKSESITVELYIPLC